MKPTPGKLRKKIGILEANNNNVNFDDMFISSKKTKIIKIHNTKEDTMFISPANELEDIEIEIKPNILFPGKYGKLIIHFNPENRNFGKMTDVALINIEFAGKQYQGEFTVNTNIIEDFSKLTSKELANPPKILVDTKTRIIKGLIPEKLNTEIIEIENVGTGDLYIRNIQTFDKGFIVEPTKFIVKPGEKSFLNIKIIPNYGVSKIKTIVTIISNDPEQSVISFTIIGEIDQPERTSSKKMINEVQIKKAKSIINNYKGNNKFVILDVRTAEEYNIGYIEDAVNVDFNGSNFKKMIKLMDKQKIYLVYCESGTRSKKAVDLMSEMGFKKIYHIYEGIEGWKSKQLKLIHPEK